MRKLFFGVLALIVILLIAIIAIPFLIPASVYKSTIEDQLSRELGRAVTIDGDISVSPLPVLKAKTGRVTIANLDGFEADHFAAMNGMEARIKLLPLLSKRVEIAAFTLNDPEIHLEKLADGRSNWELGNSGDVKPKDKGPFKRDGRYSNIDPSIGKFTLKNGTISYADAQANKSYNLGKVNMDFSLSSLSSPVSIDGNLIFNGMPMDMDLTLDTPRSFLDGQKTPVSIVAQTEFGDLSAKGHFTESQDITFLLDIDSSIRDLLPLSAYIPKNLPITGILKSIDLSGSYGFDGQKVEATNTDISLKGPLLDTRFTGDARFDQKPVLNGALQLNAYDVAQLSKSLGLEINGADLANTLELKADLKAENNGFVSDNVSANIQGEGLDMTFDGSASFIGSPKANGVLTGNIASIPNMASAMGLDMPQAKAFGDAKARGQLSLDGNNITLDLAESTTASPHLNASYTGKIIKSGDVIELDGVFDSKIPSMSGFQAASGTQIPYANSISKIDASGAVKGTPDDLIFSDVKLALSEGQVNGSFAGGASLSGDGIELDGIFDTMIPSLSNLAAASGTQIPYANSISKIDASGAVKGKPDDLALSNIKLALSDGQVNGNFTGGATFNNGFNLNGHLDADIPSARTLAEASGTKLPASTAAGEIYEHVALKGNVTGTPAAIKFANANLVMDDISGQGDFTLDMAGTTPTLIGKLDLGQLDLRPYMAAYTAQNTGSGTSTGIQPWSKTPYNFEALKMLDGNFDVKTPEVLFGPLKMGQTDIAAQITDGILTARLPKVNLYGGLGVLTATLDASGDIPKVKMDVKLEDITTNSFLASIANYTKVEGEGHTLLELSGEGRSQDEIMKSLDGYGDFKVLNGIISGVDLSQFLTGFDDVFKSRAIPKGLGKDYSTKFQDVVGIFKIQDGVVSIDEFNLSALDAMASGSGKFDIGNQSVDFSLRPRLTGSDAGDVASFGIPLKIQGNWGAISTGLDTDLLGNIAAEKATLRAKKELTDRIGGELGGVLGNVLGTKNDMSAPTTEDSSTSNAQAVPIQVKKDDVVDNILGGILGQKDTAPDDPSNDNSAPTEPEDKKPAEEELVEDALKSLFGKKKKKKSGEE